MNPKGRSIIFRGPALAMKRKDLVCSSAGGVSFLQSRLSRLALPGSLREGQGRVRRRVAQVVDSEPHPRKTIKTLQSIRVT